MSLKRKPEPPAARPITAFFAPLARPAAEVKPESGKGVAAKDADGVPAPRAAGAGAGAALASPPGAVPALSHGRGLDDHPGAPLQKEEVAPGPPQPAGGGPCATTWKPAPDLDAGAAYEAERAARIAANAARLAAMGIKGALAAPEVAPAPKRPRHPRPAPPPPEACRRSTRARGGVAPTGDATTTSPALRPRSPSPEDLCFDDETVLRYVASAGGSVTAPASSPSGPVLGFAPLPVFLACPPIARLYSIASHPTSGLLAAGGKDGWAAVWGVRDVLGEAAAFEETDRLPLASGRLHRSWCADVALVGSSSTLPLLISASNDGAVAAWNLGACAASAGGAAPAPQQLATATVHGGAGIFSLSARGGDDAPCLATAAKDGSVVVSALQSDGRGITPTLTWEDAHAGVAKCVRWGPEGGPAANLLASCGNDGAARVWDTRQGPSASAASSFLAFGCAANAVRWVDAHTLAVAGGEPDLRLFDLRKVGEGAAPSALTPPSLVLRGHVPTAGRVSGIYQPAVWPGAAGSIPFIISGGPKTRALSLYRSDSAAAVSRGAVDHDTVTLAAVGGGNGALLAVTGCRGLHLYRPRGA